MPEHKHSRHGKRKLKRILEGEGICSLHMSHAHSLLHFGRHAAAGGSLLLFYLDRNLWFRLPLIFEKVGETSSAVTVKAGPLGPVFCKIFQTS